MGRRIPRFDGALPTHERNPRQIFDIFIEPGIFQPRRRLTRQRSNKLGILPETARCVHQPGAVSARDLQLTVMVARRRSLATRVFHGDASIDLEDSRFPRRTCRLKSKG